MNYLRTSLAVCMLPLAAAAQDMRNTGVMKERKNTFYEDLKKANEAFHGSPEKKKLRFYMDFSGMDIPGSPDEFKVHEAEKPESQGQAGTCWCFSTTSFYESEIKRQTGRDIRLSELYTVYWEYVEKAREYVRTRGKSAFGQGSETNAVMRMMDKYGIVPLEAYNGIKPGQPYHDHNAMFDEMEQYLASVSRNNAWNETEVAETIRSIMNHHIGAPPVMVSHKGKSITPRAYLDEATGLRPADYVDFMSLLEKPYWTRSEYVVPDNWWHSDDYHNVPLDIFVEAVRGALRNGYTLAIGGDVSESGIDLQRGVMMVPSYDIPSEYIDAHARQFRFSNKSTTDDHAMHLVGFAQRDNGMWYLVKDSGSGGHNNESAPGYYYMHEDFLKLKMMSFTVHRDAVKDILKKFPEKISLK